MPGDAVHVTYRRARDEDAAGAYAVMLAGFESYVAFVPAGWVWPETAESIRRRLAASGSWGVVAVAGGEIVGIGAFEPGREDRTGPRIEGLAHVFAVFVAERLWGTGVAAEVMARTVAEMAARGYTEARLYTPAAQARARAFYAREGWREVAGPLRAEELGVELMELRRGL